MSKPAAGVARTQEASSTLFAVHPFETIDKAPWDALFRASRTTNLFYDHGVITAAQSVWPRYRTLQVICGRENGELVLAQPFIQRHSGFAKVVELLRLPTSDCNEPMVAGSPRASLSASLLDFIRHDIRPDILIADSASKRWLADLYSMSATARPVVKRVQAAPVLFLPSSLDAWWRSLKSHPRNVLKRRMRKAADAGIRFRWRASGADSAADLDSAFRELTRLHRMRFDAMNRASFFVKDDMQRFHGALCARPDNAAVSVGFTEAVLDGNIIGSMYGMSTDQVYIYLMTGFDPAFSEYSIGNLLIYSTIENLIARGVSVFDFKCGEETYKKRWTADQYRKYDVRICLSTNGRLTEAALGCLNQIQGAGRIRRSIGRRINAVVHMPKARPGRGATGTAGANHEP
jgi:CelD/BcsL family acetyltransferase involved in cellulose biosynthesis